MFYNSKRWEKISYQQPAQHCSCLYIHVLSHSFHRCNIKSFKSGQHDDDDRSQFPEAAAHAIRKVVQRAACACMLTEEES
jgi:hypothetical protein